MLSVGLTPGPADRIVVVFCKIRHIKIQHEVALCLSRASSTHTQSHDRVLFSGFLFRNGHVSTDAVDSIGPNVQDVSIRGRSRVRGKFASS